MFLTLEEVPAPLVAFYKEQTLLELQLNEDGSPQMVEESFSYEDENGIGQTGTRWVPLYLPVVRVVKIPRTEGKSIDDVWFAARLHKGTRDDLLKSFLGMVNAETAETFHDDYLEWFMSEPKADDPQFVSYDHDGNPYYDSVLYQEALSNWQSKVPADLVLIDVDQWFLDNAQELRKLAYPSREEQMEMQFNDMMNGTTTWQEAIMAVNLQYPLPS